MLRPHQLIVLVAIGAGSPLAAQNPDGPIAPPSPKYQIEMTKGVMIPMRDGVRLAANISRPVGLSGRLPVILLRTPYNKETYGGSTMPAKLFGGQGYIVVSQDVRGQFASEGNYRVQLKDADDGYDTIDWIVKQDWSNGKVGTYGCSYLGEVQYLLSKRHHPAHVAMIPQSASGATGPAGGYYTNFGANEGGALTLSSIFGWFGFAGHRQRDSAGTVIGVTNAPKIDYPTMLKSLPLRTMASRAGYPDSDFEDYVTHPPADPYWDEVGYLRDDDQFDTPAIHVNSWLDVTPEQTLYDFNLMRRNARSSTARNNQFVIMSPTTHCASEFSGTAHTKVGDREFGDARLPFYQIYLDWFDHWLRGAKNNVLQRPKVQYYVMGKNEWRTAPTWPVPGMRPTSFFLSSGGHANGGKGDGVLVRTKPATSGSDTYTYDPDNPVPSKGGTICCTGNSADLPGVFDQSAVESRPDVLVYTLPALTQPLTIAGTVKAVLYVKSDAKDTDFTAKLLDVDTEGRAWNVLNGVKRARYREGYARTVWMERDKVYKVEVSLKATAFQFAPGHRVRLYLSSSDFPLYDRNLNTGGNNYDETTWVKATNSILHGGAQASYLVLPVIRN